ncbi:MAG: tRNA-dihydrouridine synthase family protein [Muribaculum sp.]|nr:tRNA-dihydrouridine synthase family protein [Muribaculaceae bacterium]MCM1080620.1 tRNA-dihydrouridine synthase family protein [Muribaculum sp.]
MKIFSAPIQGHTDLAWRRFHHDTFGDSVDRYFIPFIRLEAGEVRHKDMRELLSDMNTGLPLTPQIIFRNCDEFRRLTDSVIAAGYDSLDLNMGCPFVPQVKHGRGSAIIRQKEVLIQIANAMMRDYSGLEFSVKMRLGVDSADEWRGIISIINDMPLCHLTVHPRTATQQYNGELHLDEFDRLISAVRHPVVFNGDIENVDDIDRIESRWPDIFGVMVGRGLLTKPSLPMECKTRKCLSEQERKVCMVELHDKVCKFYCEVLAGETQILSKIKPYWEFSEPLIGHKNFKSIKKATNMAKYKSIISNLV